MLVPPAFEEIAGRRDRARREGWLFVIQVVSVFIGLGGIIIGLFALFAKESHQATIMERCLTYLLSELNRHIQRLLPNLLNSPT